MSTAYITHSDCEAHVTPAGHPEQVARLQVINSRLDSADYSNLLRINAPKGTLEQATLCHPSDYVNKIKASCPDQGHATLDGDTHVCAGSFDAAMRGVGGICRAVDMVMDGEARNAFCATRPPGHHAETQTPMGFCLFGTVAIGARHALETRGLSRVAIVDFDVHHGNGTQDLVWNDPRIMFATSQQMPLWPGTGEASEVGAHNNVINLPLKPYSTGSDLMTAYQRDIFPRLAEHKPEMLFISAGFDAHKDDPLANLDFSTQDFTEITNMLCDFANTHCQGRVVSTLEGGYDLPALAESVAAHVNVLMEHAK
jgi:acetoin utilization deacetylase AcuC-like enzyme